MFSSEQILEISGEMEQLETTIEFAINMHGIGKSGISYQITDDGKYCLGWGDGNGWTKLPFDFDAHIVAEIVKQHLKKQKYDNLNDYDDYDGSTEHGFLMKAIPNVFSDEEKGIKKPFYGIVSIEPFINFYAK